MRIAIVGAGYVGVVTGACLAELGHHVTCVDIDADRVAQINAGRAPMREEGLDDLLARHVGHTLSATTDVADAVRGSALTLLTVDTPLRGDGQIDLRPIDAAARAVGAALRGHDGHHVVVVKSTVVPGTTDDHIVPALEQSSGRRAGRDFGVGVNPEFLTEGRAVRDCMDPDRVVLGATDERTLATMEQVYAPQPAVPRIRTTRATAELIKYASNALLATMISFANEIGHVAAALDDVDVVDVVAGVHASHYLSPQDGDGRRVRAPITAFLEAGCGFGGSCLPKDVAALVAHGRALGAPMRLLDAVLDVNAGQPQRLVELARRGLGGLDGARVTVLGLSFKPDTDDVRQSPAFPVIDLLLRSGAVVTAYDPVANDHAARAIDDERVIFAPDLATAVDGADAVVLVTRWRHFDRVPELLAAQPAPPLLVDGRRVIDHRDVGDYAGIGVGLLTDR